jgi:hypothetical protein
VADELAAGTLVALRVPEFTADTMTLFAIRRRDRPHGVVAELLWTSLGASDPPPAEPRRSGRR